MAVAGLGGRLTAHARQAVQGEPGEAWRGVIGSSAGGGGGGGGGEGLGPDQLLPPALAPAPPLPPLPPSPPAAGVKLRKVVTSRWQSRALGEFDSAVRVARRDGVT